MRRAAAGWPVAVMACAGRVGGEPPRRRRASSPTSRSASTRGSVPPRRRRRWRRAPSRRPTTTNFEPSLTLNVDSLVYPNLRLNTGGVFGISKAYSESLFPAGGLGTETDSTITRLRPFFLLRSTNPVFSPGVGFFRREDRARTAGFAGIKLVNDDYAAYLGWKPEGGPQSDFQFVQNQHVRRQPRVPGHDEGPRLAHLQLQLQEPVGLLQRVVSRHDRPPPRLRDRADLERRTSRATRAPSSSSDSSGTRSTTSTTWTSRPGPAGQSGEVDLPLIPNAGLATFSDTPVTAALVANPLLIDGNLTAGAGIDLGVPAPGTRMRRPGTSASTSLNRTEVNRLLVWVDRELPVRGRQVVHVGGLQQPRQPVWRRETVVSAAPFGPFENRFEIDLSRRHRPLRQGRDPTALGGGAGLVAVHRHPRDRAAGVSSGGRPEPSATSCAQTIHTVNTDVRMRLLDAPSLFYEGFYLYNGPDRAGTEARTRCRTACRSTTRSAASSRSTRARRVRAAAPIPRATGSPP